MKKLLAILLALVMVFALAAPMASAEGEQTVLTMWCIATESDANRRYLQVGKERLRGRGLADQFYKEYSYWGRNARVAHVEARMELSQLLAIDKTKRVRVGDITGFIRKMQYTISNRTGLGMVKMEIMYI